MIPLTVGTILQNRYKILEVLGTGGMSTVYLALDQQVSDVRAVKVMDASMLQQATWLDRFRQEALILQRLRHPHIVNVYEAGSVNDCHFIVMEYVRGKTIADWLQTAPPFTTPRALDVTRQVALGLHAIQAHHVINRDIKSQNVMETADGLVKIIDFGIAKSFDLPDLTGPAHGIVGTIYYLSPEQIRRQPLDIRSDIYSLGVVMYEMIAGRLPFDSHNAAEVLDHILRRPPPALQSVAPTVPPNVARVVHRCLAKRPETRFQSPAELIQAIDAILIPRQVFLLVESTGQAFPVTAPHVILGRQAPQSGVYPDIDLAAADPPHRISRRHAALVLREGAWYIREEPQVMNGTYVNEQRVPPGQLTRLRNGDRIRLAGTTLILQAP